MTTVRIVVGVAGIVGFFVCGVLASIKWLELVDRVNEKVPEARRYKRLWWYPHATLGFYRVCKSLNLRRQFAGYLAVSALGLLSWWIGMVSFLSGSTHRQ